jgi:hypothetical protein
MAWRLGTFNNESRIERVNELLEHAESLPNWKHEGKLLQGGDFADFWSLVWQLQVAEYLSRQGTNVSWNAAGPDLSVEVGGRKLFVECYVYRKSFGAVLFVEELLLLLGSDDLRVSYDLCLPFTLPQDAASLSEELSRLMAPLLDKEILAEKRCVAKKHYPIVLSKSSCSDLEILLVGPHVQAYDPSVRPSNVGDPAEYLKVAFREAVNAKASSNNLGCHRPNLVVVNYLLSQDAQLALDRSYWLSTSFPEVCARKTIDAFAFAETGIDGALSRNDLRLVMAASDDHPAYAITVPAT